jgi:hypothetical protein
MFRIWRRSNHYNAVMTRSVLTSPPPMRTWHDQGLTSRSLVTKQTLWKMLTSVQSIKQILKYDRPHFFKKYNFYNTKVWITKSLQMYDIVRNTCHRKCRIFCLVRLLGIELFVDDGCNVECKNSIHFHLVKDMCQQCLTSIQKLFKH